MTTLPMEDCSDFNGQCMGCILWARRSTSFSPAWKILPLYCIVVLTDRQAFGREAKMQSIQRKLLLHLKLKGFYFALLNYSSILQLPVH